jgi:flagellar hook assembly protein FlgD
LPDAETVSWKVIGPTGTVKDTALLGTFAKGAHSFAWNGKDSAGHVVKDGTYAIVLSTAATVSGRKLVGRVTKNVVVDLTAPKITVVTGGATTIFPSGGSTPTSLAAKVTLTEPGAITLTVRNAGGALVRTVIAAGKAGTTTVTWNGTNAAGAPVTSGTYTWRVKAIDVAGNARSAGPYTIDVLRLANRSTTLVLNGNQKLQAVGCGYYYTSGGSTFAAGMWLIDDCAQSGGVTTAEGDYQFTVPTAFSYSSVTIVTSAYSHGGATRMFGAIRTSIGPSPHVVMSPTAPAVSNLGTFTQGIVNANHQVIVGVGVDNSLRSPSDLDIGWVAITVSYTVKL